MIVIHGIAPPNITDLVSIKQQGSFMYNLRSSAGILLASPKGKTKATLGDRSFTVATPKLWNALLCELRAISYLCTFKGHLNYNPLTPRGSPLTSKIVCR